MSHIENLINIIDFLIYIYYYLINMEENKPYT